ncbi:MAG: UMP kinase [Bacilli bacterium]|nr:UMP kinase [Bacilli bacterium]
MKYKRILIKVSGEALADDKNHLILDKNKLESIAKVVKKLHQAKVQVGIVIGAVNIWRGKLAKSMNIDPATGDYMGMIATVINATALSNAIERFGLKCRVMSSVEVKSVAEPYLRLRAIAHLNAGKIVIFAGGTGNPYFTTDTAAALRATEIEAEAIFLAKNGVDGVYTADPRTNKNAKLIKKISFQDCVNKKLGVMDLTALTTLIASNDKIKIHVFGMKEKNFLDVVNGKNIGTVLSKDGK